MTDCGAVFRLTALVVAVLVSAVVTARTIDRLTAETEATTWAAR